MRCLVVILKGNGLVQRKHCQRHQNKNGEEVLFFEQWFLILQSIFSNRWFLCLNLVYNFRFEYLINIEFLSCSFYFTKQFCFIIIVIYKII